jgi:mitogen-activated protein kinase organizer 1
MLLCFAKFFFFFAKSRSEPLKIPSLLLKHTLVPSVKARQSSGVLKVCFTSSGYLVSAGKDRCLRLWNSGTGAAVKVYEGHSWDVCDVAVGADNNSLASCAGKEVLVHDVVSGEVVRRLRGHEARVNCLCFSSADRSVLFTGSNDKAVLAWDMRSGGGRPIDTIAGCKDSVTSILCSGTDVVCGTADGAVRSYSVATGRVTVDTFPSSTTSVAMSRDTNCLLVATLGSRMHLVERSSGDLLNTYKGHVNEVGKVDACFSHDDANVAIGSEDGDVVVWDLVDAEVVSRERAHTAPTSALAWMHGKNTFATGSIDGTIKIWSLRA